MRLTEEVFRIDLGKGLYAEVDADDRHLVEGYRWRSKPSGRTSYARRNPRATDPNQEGLMHRVILGAKPGEIVDHKDRNGLNNRRSNLRIVSHSHNNANVETTNRHGYRGICFDPRCKSRPWHAVAKLNQTSHHFGNYESKEAAALAHDIGLYGLRRDLLLLNFPDLFKALEASNAE